MATAARLTASLADKPLNYMIDGYRRFRRYAPHMLKLLGVQSAAVAMSLVESVRMLSAGNKETVLPDFFRPGSK